MKRILDLLDCRDREVNVLYLDDEGIRLFNNKYLGRNKPTNVIAFAMHDGDFGNVNPDVLGDILISVETASRDAFDSSISIEEMLDYLVIHGILHLIGYDHEAAPKSTGKMKRKEEEIFSLLHGYRIDARHA